jgi:hypothetical protein
LKDQYKLNQEIHKMNAGFSTNLRPPISNLAIFQRGAYYFGTKLFSYFPSTTESFYNELKLARPA